MSFKKFARLLHVPITDLFKKETYKKLAAQEYAEGLRTQAVAAMDKFLGTYRKLAYDIMEGVRPAPTGFDARSRFSYECSQIHEGFVEKLRSFAASQGVDEEEIASKLGKEEIKRVSGGEFITATQKLIEDARMCVGYSWFGHAANALREWQDYWERNGLHDVMEIADPAIFKLGALEEEYAPIRAYLEGKSARS